MSSYRKKRTHTNSTIENIYYINLELHSTLLFYLPTEIFLSNLKRLEHTLNNISIIIIVIKSQGAEVILGIRTSIDLNSTQKGQSLLDPSLSTVDNITNKNILTIIKSIRKFLHAVIGIIKTLTEWKDKLLNSSLLKIRELLQFGCDFGTSIGNSLEVVGCSNGRTTAVINEGNSRPFDLTNHPIPCNTNVRSMNEETETVIGNVCTHGTKSSVTSEGESRKTTQVEVVSVDLVQIIL